MAVTDLSLRVYKNQITVLLGHNGAGKTTLLKMITGFLDCTSGLVLVRGYDIKTCTRNARESIGYCPQNNILYDDLTVEENLMVFALIKGIRRDKVRQVVFTLLNDVGLWYCRTAIAPQLSPGQQRSLCAAIAILGRPKVIIMDEPTAYMDPHSRREMWELLLTIRRSCTILLTTQNLDEADVLGDRIAIMINGRIRCIGSTTFLKQQFGTGYHMRINKMDGCKVTLIEKVLRKYAPKAALQSDSDREAVFVLGQIATTQNIIMMFTELENKTKVLRIHSMGLAVTSLEDVVILVGEDQPTYGRHERPAAGGDEQQVQVGVHESQLKVVTSATANQPSSAAVVRALLKKRAIHAWRERRMPLFIWVIPPLLLTLLFVLENFATRGTGNEVERTGDTLRYSFPDVFIFATGFVQADTQDSILKNYLEPMFTNDFDILRVPKEDDINTYLLEYAGDSLRKFVFDLHFGVQMTTNG
ncbi:phospholipid-transporting ATPase ABCA3-like [Haemaphysalis longicornis]